MPTLSKWLCAHPEAQKGHQHPATITISKVDATISKVDATITMSKVDAAENDQPLSPSLYHPKKCYFQGFWKSRKKDTKVIKVEEDSETCLKPPSQLVFTEDLLYSNFDWGLGESPLFVNSPPPPI